LADHASYGLALRHSQAFADVCQASHRPAPCFAVPGRAHCGLRLAQCAAGALRPRLINVLNTWMEKRAASENGTPLRAADTASYFFTERCRTASYRQTPLATDTFRLSTLPAIGIFITISQVSRVRRRMPSPSAPITSATGPSSFVS
jgi:hypothetical protein